MSKKILYFDVETTGKSAYKNDIVQLSGIIEIDGKIVETFNLKMRPLNPETIEDEALEVTGLTKSQIMEYPDPRIVFKQFTAILGKHVSKTDKYDKFFPAGYNVGFDLDFLQCWFKKMGDRFGTGTWQNWRAIDGLQMVRFLEFSGKLPEELCFPNNVKLSTVCKHYGIEIDAHDALSDITATRELLLLLRGKLA